MAAHEDIAAQVDQTLENTSDSGDDFGEDSGSDNVASTRATSPDDVDLAAESVDSARLVVDLSVGSAVVPATVAPGAGLATVAPAGNATVDATGPTSAVDAMNTDTGATKRPMDVSFEGPAAKRQKSAALPELKTLKARKEEKRKRTDALKHEVNTKTAIWETANPDTSKSERNLRRKMIQKDVSDQFKARGDHPEQIDVSSKPKAGTATLIAKDKADSATPAPEVAPAGTGRVPQSVPPHPQGAAANHLGNTKAKDTTAKKEKASSDKSNAIQKPTNGSKKGAKNDSRKKLPTAKKPEHVAINEEVIIDASNKAICDAMAARAQAAATETISKAMEEAEKTKKEADIKASQIMDEARARAEEAVAKAHEKADEVEKGIITHANTRANENFVKADEEADRIMEQSHSRCDQILNDARADSLRAERDMEEVRRQAQVGIEEARKALHDVEEATSMLRRGKEIFDAYLSGVATRYVPGELLKQPEQPEQPEQQMEVADPMEQVKHEMQEKHEPQEKQELPEDHAVKQALEGDVEA